MITAQKKDEWKILCNVYRGGKECNKNGTIKYGRDSAVLLVTSHLQNYSFYCSSKQDQRFIL